MEWSPIEEVMGEGLWHYFEMRTEGRRCVGKEPRFLACETRPMAVVGVTEMKRVEAVPCVWTTLCLRDPQAMNETG